MNIEADWNLLLDPYTSLQVQIWTPDGGYHCSHFTLSDQKTHLSQIIKSLLDGKVRIVNNSHRVLYEGSMMDLALSRLENRNAGVSADDVRQIIDRNLAPIVAALQRVENKMDPYPHMRRMRRASGGSLS